MMDCLAGGRQLLLEIGPNVCLGLPWSCPLPISPCPPPSPPASLIRTHSALQAVQRSERELAGADSRFFKIDGIELHYKRCTPLKPGPSSAAGASTPGGNGSGAAAAGAAPAPGQQGQGAGRPPVAVHCLHGFGASCYRCAGIKCGEGVRG